MKNYTPDAIGRASRVAIVAIAGLSLLAGTGFGQSAAATEDAVKLEKFVVTGSNIPSTETTAEARTFPVATIDRRLIDQSGLLNTAELLQKITLSNGGSVPFTNNATGFTPGASSTSLRGLGPEATLVLVNGRRMPFYPIGTGGTTAFIDLNSIPLSAVERIEVLKDGASAVYGADAVAGVVNIIFRKGYDGAEFAVNYGNTTNKDSSEFSASVMYGVTTDKSSIMVGANYYSREPIFHRDREYSKVPPFLSSNASPPNLQLTRATINEAQGRAADALFPGVAATVNFLRNDEVYNADALARLGLTGSAAWGGAALPAAADLVAPGFAPPLVSDAGTMRARRDVLFASTFAVRDTNLGNLPASAYAITRTRSSSFNFNEFAGSFPEISRKGAFAAWERKLTENVTSYGDFFFQQVHQIDELAPYATGNFESPGQTSIVIPARTANPILTSAEIARGGRSAVPGAYNPFNPFNQDISGGSRIRLAEFGNRVFHNRNTAFALTGGIKFDNIMDKWNLDAGIRYGSIQNDARAKLISTSRFLRAMNANDPIFNPASPSYIGTTQPYNPFGYFRNPITSNAAPVNFATHYTRDENRSATMQASALINTASLMELPAGDAGFAFGAEFRRETVAQAVDSTTQSGDLLGTPASAITLAQRKIASYFAEVEIPLFSEKRSVDFAHGLSLNIAARYEDFLTSNRNAFVPKFGVRWQPLADGSVVVRGSYGKGFREPSLFELFSGKTSGLLAIVDSRTGAVEPEQTVTSSGNSKLEAEDTESRNVGVVWSPKGRLEGFTGSVDVWRIAREGTVSINHQDTVDRSVGRDPLGAARPGGLRAGESVVRDLGGNIIQVNGVFINAGETIASGVDLAASYTWNTANWGRFDVGANVTYLGSYRQSTVPGVAPDELIDLAFDSGDDAYIRIRGQGFIGWVWKGLSARVTANYNHSYDDLGGDPNGDFYGELPFRVEANKTYDVQVSYKLFPSKSRQDSTWWSDLKLTAGAQNVLDEDPPFVSDYGNNSNGYPGFVYNDVGRFVYFGLEKKL